MSPLEPPTASVVELLDAVRRTPWPTHLGRCDDSWGPLGIHLSRQMTLPPGHEDELIHELVLPLGSHVDASLAATRDGRPLNLGCFLYQSETGDADEQTKHAFEAIAEAMTETWGTDDVQDRTPGARVWEVDDLVIELYHHVRPAHPHTAELLGPACLQVGLGPPETLGP